MEKGAPGIVAGAIIPRAWRDHWFTFSALIPVNRMVAGS